MFLNMVAYGVHRFTLDICQTSTKYRKLSQMCIFDIVPII